MNERRQIGQIATIRRGASPRPIGDSKYFGGEVGWVRIVDVTNSRKYLRMTEQYLSKAGESLSVRVRPGELIMSICATIGKPIIVDMEACIHDGFVKFSNLRDVNTQYLYYVLQYSEQKFVGMAQPGTQLNINTSLVEQHRIYCPTIAEQQKIVEILSTVDEAIEKTELLINKYEQIKAGLMSDLFTRGIGPDGKLRPSRDEAPYLYKESSLGWIPIDWLTKTISEIAIRVGSGVTPTGGENVYCDEGILFIRSQNIKNDGLDLSDVAHIDSTTHKRMLNSEVFPFDVLINITGASIGRCCFIPEGTGIANTNQHVCCIRLAKKSIEDAIYLSNLLSSPIGQKQIFRLNAGGNREGLNYQQLRSFIIPWPESDERKMISIRLTEMQTYLAAERRTLIQFNQQKIGLMYDLLADKSIITV